MSESPDGLTVAVSWERSAGVEEEQVPRKYIQEKGKDRMRRQEMHVGKQQQEEERTNENWQVDKRTKELCLMLKAANHTNHFPM